MLECTLALDFKNASVEEGDNLNGIIFRGMLMLPPFILKLLIDARSVAPEELGFLVILAKNLFLLIIQRLLARVVLKIN